MPLHDFRCEAGHRFEANVPITSAAVPSCPSCGTGARKVPSAGALLGRASAGLSQDRMPQTWKGTYGANPEYVAGLRKQWSDRQRLEAKYPEIAGDQRPVLAHEGRFHEAPLRKGDVDLGAGGAGHGHGHSHGQSHGAGHGHSHGAGHSHGPATPAPSAPAATPAPAAKPASPGS